ncbi:MAG: protease pro-enzyme activation domain-containing protein [Acidimicrobiales bacterium]|jgi:hypothetical protein
MDNDVRVGQARATASAGGRRSRSGPFDRRGRARRTAGATLAATLVAGLAAAAGGSAVASASVRQARLDSLASVQAAPRLAPLGARALGPVRATTEISGALALEPRSQAAITRFISDVTNPHSPLYHHYLAKGQYADRFGPTKATIAAVRHQLLSDGLKVTSVSSNGLLVAWRGSASRVETAFHTGLERVSLAGGALGQATTSSVRLPVSIARDVQAVVGLDDLVREASTLARSSGQAHEATRTSAPRSGSGGPVACPAAAAEDETGATTDQQLASAYGVNGLYSAGDLGAGQTVDIYELEPYLKTDIQQFDECYFGADHTSNITNITVDGGPGTGAGSAEAALDVEDVSAIAPDAHIHVFLGPNMDDPFGPLDTWNAIAVADDAHQITSSWGVCETALQVGAPGVQEAENNIFEQTAAQGQSVFSSAGDDGSDDCAGHNISPVATDLSLDDPSSQPYVVSVGGTTFLTSSYPPDETVWNNGNFGGAGGGGISETWAMPSWQAGFITAQEAANQACSDDPTGAADNYHLAGDPTTLPSGTSCREAPDVTGLADPQTGITIYYSGQWLQIGGTSSSTPLWAAMTAEVNASAACGSGNVGFVNPLLYEVGAGADASSAFNDITVGNNDNLDVGNGTTYPAGPGYDLASGLGSPRITNPNGEGLANQLCALATTGAAAAPAVSGIVPPAGPATGGGTVVINGSNFGDNTGQVFFGDVAATVTNWTSTAVTVDLPPYTSPAGSFAGEGGSDVVTVTTSTSPGPVESSSPGTTSLFHYTGGTSGSPTPIVDYVSSSTGGAGGGNVVTIVGSGFEEAGGVTGVTFGTLAGTSVSVLDDDELTVDVPAEGSGTVCANDTAFTAMCQTQVVVSNANGPSATSTIEPAYSGPITFQANGAFVAPPGTEAVAAPTEYDYSVLPTITSVTPGYASETGGTPITITGNGFNLLDLYWVNIGPAGVNTSEDFDLLSVKANQIIVGAPGDANITALTTEPDPTEISVQNSAGLGTARAGSLAFAGVPTLTGLSAHVGSQPAPAALTITGKGLRDANLIAFVGQGGLDFLDSTTTNFAIDSDTSITVTPPQFFDIATDVLVCSATGCSAVNPSVDTYVFVEPGRPIVNSSSPSSGGEQGGTFVTIDAQLDSNLVSVDFGKVPATTIVSSPFITSSGPIEVLAPPSTKTGKVDITISTLGGAIVGQPTSATTRTATFTYSKSAPSAPQDLKVTAGKDSASASWKAPVTTGGDSISGYLVTATSKGQKTVTVTTTKLSATLSGLTAKKTYVVTVVAESKLGKGLPATATVTPT